MLSVFTKVSRGTGVSETIEVPYVGDVIAFWLKDGYTGVARLDSRNAMGELIFDEPVVFDSDGDFILDGTVEHFQNQVVMSKVLQSVTHQEWLDFCDAWEMLGRGIVVVNYQALMDKVTHVFDQP